MRNAVIEISLSTVQYGTQSFTRGGGVTALYHQTGDVELVESVGGWSHRSGTARSYAEVQQRLAGQAVSIGTAAPVQRQRAQRLQCEKRLRERNR